MKEGDTGSGEPERCVSLNLLCLFLPTGWFFFSPIFGDVVIRRGLGLNIDIYTAPIMVIGLILGTVLSLCVHLTHWRRPTTQDAARCVFVGFCIVWVLLILSVAI